MRPGDIITLLETKLPHDLARHLVEFYCETRTDLASRTLGRASLGKFVEAFVQALEFLEKGSFSASPRVDDFLKALDSRASPLNEGLRICASRVARAVYTLRNKRSIAHKNAVEATLADLSFAFNAMQWILCELVQTIAGKQNGDLDRAISYLSSQPGTVIEDFGGKKLVLLSVTIDEEILVLLLHSPGGVMSVEAVKNSMARASKGSITNALSRLWRKKLIERTEKKLVQITTLGRTQALEIVKSSLASQ